MAKYFLIHGLVCCIETNGKMLIDIETCGDTSELPVVKCVDDIIEIRELLMPDIDNLEDFKLRVDTRKKAWHDPWPGKRK